MVTKKRLKSEQQERELIGKERTTAKKWLIIISGVFLAGLVRAISVYCFVAPNEFAPGGVTGIATMLENKLPGHPSSGYFLFAINIPLLIIAFIFLGKRFGLISGAAIILSSLLMPLFDLMGLSFLRIYGQSTGDRMLYALAGGIIGGVGIAVMLKLGGSCGGTDVIATIIQRKYEATNVTWFIFMLDSSVVIASFFVYGFDIIPVLLSFIEMFSSSKVAETILEGFKSALKFEIITNHPNELSQDIMQQLHRGVTMINAKGMYTGEERAMLICILSKRQLSNFKGILRKYPDTFAYVSGTSEVVGAWGNGK